MRVLLVDPSSHGGIALYSDLVARSLVAAGATPTLLASRGLDHAERQYEVRRLLPRMSWGRPDDAGLRFYADRAAGWATSALVVEALALASRPQVVHFQAPINRRLDAKLIRAVRVVAPVVWTSHDVLPFDGTEKDAARFAAIYRAADLVLVHGRVAAEEVRELAGVEAAVIAHAAPEAVVSVDRTEARRRLNLPAKGRIVAALGFIRHYKRYGFLAEVWEKLGDQAPILLVMGEVMDESERPALDRLAATGRAIVRPTYATYEQLQLAVVASNALVLPYEISSESGLVHQARALGVPVLVSDERHLAASVELISAGRVVAGGADSWGRALTGDLPPPPSPPPRLEEAGHAHLEAYDLVRRRRR